MTGSSVRIRHITGADWPHITALEAGAYTPLGLSEERAALEAKARVSPATCFVLDVDERPAGYLLSLPYPDGEYPELSAARAPAVRSANLHLHDLVIAEHLRGLGLGTRMVRHLTGTAAAAGYARVSLVAVAGSRAFWTANGFTAHEPDRPDAGPQGYGPGAVYMSRPVAAPVPVPAPTAGQQAGEHTGEHRHDGAVPHGPTPHEESGRRI
ncbi:GNAT family N-acetyltransferase [Actinacidiphila acididurans]|uniref:GNAT family N-acetyltransferase n=1 Tax=Actinacidiphila acididurans TaxID=2784346 RepID=UPI0027DC168F|nr:GNAT family N-acetyltransferase [Actinacidiphila acididurans]